MTGEYLERLEALADPKEFRDGYHMGVKGDTLAIEVEYGRELFRMVSERKPNLIVEIGTANGYSTTWMVVAANQNRRGRIFTVDAVERKPYVWQTLDIPSLKITRVLGESQNVLDQIPAGIDFLFHDSSHRIEHVTADIEALEPKFAEHCRIVVHDTNYCRGMGDALREYFEQKPGWRYSEMMNSCGLGIADR